MDSGFNYSFQTSLAFPADRFEILVNRKIQPISLQPVQHLSMQIFPIRSKKN